MNPYSDLPVAFPYLLTDYATDTAYAPADVAEALTPTSGEPAAQYSAAIRRYLGRVSE